MLHIECREMGFDCGAVLTGKTEQELQKEMHQHGIEVHGLEESDFTPELVRRVKASIHRS